MKQPVPSEFTRVDRGMIFGLMIYGGINSIACGYFVLGLDALFCPQISFVAASVLTGSIVLGPPAILLVVITVNIVCICADYSGPNSATSCLVIAASLIISYIDMIACPLLLAGA